MSRLLAGSGLRSLLIRSLQSQDYTQPDRQENPHKVADPCNLSGGTPTIKHSSVLGSHLSEMRCMWHDNDLWAWYQVCQRGVTATIVCVLDTSS